MQLHRSILLAAVLLLLSQSALAEARGGYVDLYYVPSADLDLEIPGRPDRRGEPLATHEHPQLVIARESRQTRQDVDEVGVAATATSHRSVDQYPHSRLRTHIPLGESPSAWTP